MLVKVFQAVVCTVCRAVCDFKGWKAKAAGA